MSEFVVDPQLLRDWDDVFRATDFVELAITIHAKVQRQIPQRAGALSLVQN